MIIDVIVVLIIGLNILLGYKRGIVDMILNIVILFVSIFLSRFLHGYVVDFVSETPLYDSIFNWVMDSISLGDAIQVGADNVSEQIIESLPLPAMFINLLNIDTDFIIGNILDISAIEVAIGSAITDIIISIISIIILFIILIFGMRLLASSINFIAMLPVIRVVNKNLGAFLGAIFGFFVVWGILIIYNLVLVRYGNDFYDALYSSNIALWLHQRNFVLSLLGLS